MECLYWLKMSFDGHRSLFIRGDGVLRTVSHSMIGPVLRVPLKDYYPIVSLGVPLAPSTVYRWPVEAVGEP